MKKLLGTVILALLTLATPLHAATQKWVAGAGQGLTWGNICTTGDLAPSGTGLASNFAKQCSVIVTNGTALDLFADFSANLTSLTPGAGSPSIGLTIYPLNADASTYGDGAFTAAAGAAGPPSVQTCAIPTLASVASVVVGTGSCRGVVLPPGSFVVTVWNNLGVAINNSPGTIQYRTYNYQSN
jgi:hypothetical protein